MPWLVLLLACTTPPSEVDVGAVDHAVRASMAIRGVRPSVDELHRVAREPDALPALVDAWLRDPRFGETVRDQHARHLQLRTSGIGKVPPVGPLAGTDLGAIATSLDEAPLYLIADIVQSGRPYAEVLTTDETWADDIVATVHGLPYDPRGPRWQRTRWADGRPAAGVLADTAFNQRYMSSNTNFHRARAATALSAFLCRDLIADAVAQSAPPVLSDPTTAEDAVRTDPACTGCHRTLDVAASAFWGLHPYILSADISDAYQAGCPEGAPCFPLPFWDASAQGDWSSHDLPAPSWRGTAVDDLAGLGRAMTEDPAFAECTARRFHGWHLGVEPSGVDDGVAEALAAVLDDAGGDVRALVAASVLRADFRDAPRRVIRPEELARTVEALTGYRWEGDPDVGGCAAGPGRCYGIVDLARSDAHGFRTLLGGSDGWNVLQPADGPSPTQALAMEWLADEAAHHVVSTDATRPPAARRLFVKADPSTTSAPQVRQQIVHLHAAILGEVLEDDDPAIQRTLDLFDALVVSGEAEAAWTAVVSAMLRDHRVVLF